MPTICAGAVSTNRTIDDQFGDPATGGRPVFLPTTEGVWEGRGCVGCGVEPDPAQAFRGTWNAATFRPGEGGSGPLYIDLSFTGTAIYVYFIIANTIQDGGVITLTECNFTLDGQHEGFYRHVRDNTPEMEYNVLVFSQTNLSNTEHALVVSAGGVNYQVFVNFDYAIYT
ncbi:hypothetical protein BDZ94DRAFT_1175025 [Collybia nuda]|uniref:Uncharacterized protein n=1 Tax=Collybia nuda TaxID=64659 RepID=A0A9P6CE63_9AGAR|nr:hypothetical protein BDZ94DRAFT_1175025 [Collybia nuda]